MQTAEDTAEPDSAARPGTRRRGTSWRQPMMVVATAIILMLLIKAFVVQVYRIPSASMENTLLTGDRVLVNKLIYHVRGIDRGDIVVFSGQGSWGTTTGAPDPAPPRDPVLRAVDGVLSDIGVYTTQTYYIKRVIGLPGDRVGCCTDGKVTVNGIPLDETSYLYPGANPSDEPFNVVVPPGRLWVMGDERAISQLGDLPIPATFQQAALHAGAAGAPVLQLAGAAAGAIAAAPASGVVAAVVGVPVLALRVRAARRGRRHSCAGARR
jgi:signal peptidase I